MEERDRSPSPTTRELLKRLQGSMDLQSDPVFSDFSHVANSASISQLTFAVGLRCENPEELVARMLPLSVVKPRDTAPKKPKPKKVEEVKICQRPECVSRRDRLVQMNGENEHLKVELANTQAKLAASQNKIALTEKAISMSEDKIDSLRGQIEDTQNRIVTSEAEVEKMDTQNGSLRTVLANLQAQVEKLKASTAATQQDTQQIVATSSGGDTVVFSRSVGPRDVESARLIQSLSARTYPNQPDDSDDD